MSKAGVRLSGTNLERAAEHNQRITLYAIRVHGGITRVALAQLTGLTAPAIANIIKRLIEEELVVETGRLRKGRGQPGKVIEINPVARFSFGVNIDRNHLTFVLVNFLGEVVSRRVWDRSFLLPSEVEQLWCVNAPEMLKEGKVDPARLSGIGVALPDDMGRIYIPGAPDSFAQWQDVSIERLLAAPFNVPVLEENDATAAALGEQLFGSGQQFSSMLYVLISAGLGGALIINGHVVRGADGRSGEIGLIPLQQGGLLQDHVSLSCLAQHLERAGHTLADVHAERMDASCDGAIQAWIDDAVEALAPALSAANCIVNPAVILIGGYLPAKLIDRLAQAIGQELDLRFPDLPAKAKIRRAQLSEFASAIGAAILPFALYYLPNEDALWKQDEK